MILEFLRLQTSIQQRALHVGKLLCNWQHYMSAGASVKVAAPYIVHLGEKFVEIAVARDDMGNHIAASIPVDLFENGADGTVRSWVTLQNNAYQAAIEQKIADEDEARKRQELAILHELLAKYPSVTAE